MSTKTAWWGNLPENPEKKRKLRHLKYSGTIVITAIMMVLASIAVVVASTTVDPKMYRIGPERAVMYPAPVQDVLHSCGDIFLYYPEKQRYGVVPDSVLYSKTGKIPVSPTRIQSYGYMSPEPFEPIKRVFTPRDKAQLSPIQIMRGMWEGYYFAWYDEDKAAPSQINYLKDLTKTHPKLVVLPWLDKDVRMPFDRAFGFSTWNVSQTCQSIEAGTVESFLELNDPKSRNRAKPPIAPLNGDGKLNGIYRYSPYMFPDDVEIEKDWGKEPMENQM